jgi:hypothetical protein
VDSEGGYTLHASPEGGEAPASTPLLAAGEMRAAEPSPTEAAPPPFIHPRSAGQEFCEVRWCVDGHGLDHGHVDAGTPLAVTARL